MACPHYLKASGDCLLQEDSAPEGDEVRGPGIVDETNPDWCLGSGLDYRECPLYQRFIAELAL